MKNEGVVVYPLDSEFMPVLRQRHHISGHPITHLVSPKGWGHTDADAGNIDGAGPVGLTVSSDFDEALHECSTAVFVDTNTEVDFEKTIYTKMIKAAECSKNIICLRHLEEKQKKEIEDICCKRKTAFQYCFQKAAAELDKSPVSEELFHIETPVVFILGIAERTNKFDVQLALRENFVKQNYVVSQVGSRPYCEVLGFHSFPSFMYSTFLPEHEKIILFNHYIKNIEEKEKPDVILIGIPGTIMPMDSRKTEKFGIFAFEVSQAVKPDVAIVSSFANVAVTDFLSMLSEASKYRFGFEIDCFNLTNMAFDWRCLNDPFMHSDNYLSLDREQVNRVREKIDLPTTPVYSVVDAGEAQAMTEFVIHKLQGYAEIQAV